MDAAATYTAGSDARTREVAALDDRGRVLGLARLLLAAVSVVLLGLLVWGHAGKVGVGALAAVVLAFVALVMVHARVVEARERAAAALRFHERGLARLAHAWDRLPAGSARFDRPEHPFARDLDLFGASSVMQLVDSTETRLGEERLAALLCAEDPGVWPGEVAARQAAVRDLAGRTALREALATAGGVSAEQKTDAATLLTWAEAKETLPVALRALAWVLPLALVALCVAGWAYGVAGGVVTFAVTAAIALGVVVGAKLGPTLEGASSREQAASRWRAMVSLVEAERFEAPLLVRLQERLVSEGRRASVEIAALERIVSFADARRNDVFRLVVGPLVLWDVHCAAALVRWRARSGARVRAWLEVLAEVEALASLGGFAFEHPDFAWPELAAEPVLAAQGLGHPLVADDRRVGNDVELPGGGRALVVTGSNMSGKSTLLRALGVNVVLAGAGAPVCARSLRLGPARVATSMRIDDSLAAGVSHFYAELRCLKRVLDRAAEAGRAPVLFLLDEILHGTNSRERVIGACAVVRELVSRGALGAVSTHDLGITTLERELGASVHNVHFEEQVAGAEMTFDYVLRPGIVQSSNALLLMRSVGIDVPFPEGAAQAAPAVRGPSS